MNPFAAKLKGYLDWLQHGYLLVQIALGFGVGTTARTLMTSYTHIPAQWVTPIWLLVSGVTIGLLVLVGNLIHNRVRVQTNPNQAEALSTSAANFDIDQFFSTNYASHITTETTDNFRTIANTRYQTDQEREEFYAKFIGIGMAAYFYDMAWMGIYKSQILLLQKLNTVMLTRDQAKVFYDNAATASPDAYVGYSYDDWLQFLFNQRFITHQGVMVAITMRGRDFLKFLLHWGRSSDQRRL